MRNKLLILLIVLLSGTGCKEIPIIEPTTQLTPPPVFNTPPKVIAGNDIVMFSPADSGFLSGWATDDENNIAAYKWTQLSGPGQAIIHTPDSLSTQISQLTVGKYSFELTVMDKNRLSGKDTAAVEVLDSALVGTNILIIKDLEATCWGPECTLPASDDQKKIPQNAKIRVFFRPMYSLVWTEVPRLFYNFSSAGGFISIAWGGLEDKIKWEVMIVY